MPKRSISNKGLPSAEGKAEKETFRILSGQLIPDCRKRSVTTERRIERHPRPKPFGTASKPPLHTLQAMAFLASLTYYNRISPLSLCTYRFDFFDFPSAAELAGRSQVASPLQYNVTLRISRLLRPTRLWQSGLQQYLSSRHFFINAASSHLLPIYPSHRLDLIRHRAVAVHLLGLFDSEVRRRSGA